MTTLIPPTPTTLVTLTLPTTTLTPSTPTAFFTLKLSSTFSTSFIPSSSSSSTPAPAATTTLATEAHTRSIPLSIAATVWLSIGILVTVGLGLLWAVKRHTLMRMWRVWRVGKAKPGLPISEDVPGLMLTRLTELETGIIREGEEKEQKKVGYEAEKGEMDVGEQAIPVPRVWSPLPAVVARSSVIAQPAFLPEIPEQGESLGEGTSRTERLPSYKTAVVE
ncbi:hypothetical protein M501DRAFT_1059156 [Patellaria atrata CBS 101060]|uniref:Uncharacterized protein n=1 Tax=Patellaria atrata CBS 101060 TaxID=1346257 RepID=A0A9P4VPV7_9PEZI|nr:hypothetical protein M501DRAFT_1059156 [Patellaria atrata CBS 101060]